MRQPGIDDKHARTRRERLEDIWLTTALLAAVAVTFLTAHAVTGALIFLLTGAAPVLAGRLLTASERRRYTIAEFDRLGARDFVQSLAARFRAQGYRVRFAPADGEQGYDFLLRRGRQRVAVQVRPGAAGIDVAAVDMLAAAMSRRHATEGWLMTNGDLAPAARAAASGRDVVLWDRLRMAGFLMETAAGPVIATSSSAEE
jgi:HJR/Mrr/RecB family endonuclease